jgi:hypothetical protein
MKKSFEDAAFVAAVISKIMFAPKVYVDVDPLRDVDENTKVDALFKVMVAPQEKESRKKDSYVVFTCAGINAEDIYDPTEDVVEVFMWFGHRKPIDFSKVTAGMYFYCRRALLTSKRDRIDELQLRVYEDSIFTFYDELPAWSDKFTKRDSQ